MKTYRRGSVEFHETPILLNGDPHEPDKVIATPWLEVEPADSADWLSPVELEGGKFGLMVGSYPPGYYRTFTYAADAPEQPRIESEPFAIT